MKADENIPPANEQQFKCSCGHFGSQHFHQPGHGKGGGCWTKCMVDGCACMEYDQYDAPFSPEVGRMFMKTLGVGLLAGELQCVLQNLTELCQQIEECGASEQLTKASLTASQARQKIAELVKALESKEIAPATEQASKEHTDDIGAH